MNDGAAGSVFSREEQRQGGIGRLVFGSGLLVKAGASLKYN
jgi:hypothetical protein